jgi:hypothetical protein
MDSISQLLLDSVILTAICGIVLYTGKDRLKEFRPFIKVFFFLGVASTLIAIIIKLIGFISGLTPE